MLTVTDMRRFFSRVNKNGGIPECPLREAPGECWIWTGGKFPAGYGSFWLGGANQLTHRVSYEIAFGPIPPDLETDHVCRVRACCNPAHLEIVTSAENMRRTQRPRCCNGHPFDERNTARVAGHPNRRVCRQCVCAKTRRYRRKAAAC